jgi:hypothetical protein
MEVFIMTNEMKLLTALCDALGFDVKRVWVNEGEIHNYTKMVIENFGRLAFKSGVYKPLEPIYEYKLTKRAEV